MKTTPLHPDFGVEVHDLDLDAVTAEDGYAELRHLFDTHSLLLFRNQPLSDAQHLRLARLFGPIENRTDDPTERLSPVSNATEDGGVTAADALHTLNLIANQLWHTDSTFLPVPALANLLQARVVSSSGGETEFVSTRAGFKRLPEETRERLRHTGFRHDYKTSRGEIAKELTRMAIISKWPEQHWRAVWPNPANGEEALYIASHVCAVDGMEQAEAKAWVKQLTAAMTPPEAVYTHAWEPGDLIIWDERATMHRGRPWPYDEERTLVSVCVTARDVDGLAKMRVAPT
ncbi:TauD/TfdA dioxygenase family protein [Hwanghaeella sp.]|uniref:TauD/TfdA dioxygenase family protein n=1 Tax=Hwanghaeella sp. TaxID=2605943 RepID=UPI003CCBFEDB